MHLLVVWIRYGSPPRDDCGNGLLTICQTLFDTLPDDLDYNVTAWLDYDDSKPLPTPAFVDEFNPFDDMTLVPFDNQTLLGEPDKTIELDVIMDNLGDGAN